MVGAYAQTLKPSCTGDKWGYDEKMQKVRGKESYMIDRLHECVEKAYSLQHN